MLDYEKLSKEFDKLLSQVTKEDIEKFLEEDERLCREEEVREMIEGNSINIKVHTKKILTLSKNKNTSCDFSFINNKQDVSKTFYSAA